MPAIRIRGRITIDRPRRGRRVMNDRFPPDPRANVRKPKWHGKGWRDNFWRLYFNMHRCWGNFTRYVEIGEDRSIEQLLATLEDEAYRDCEHSMRGLHFEFFLRKTRIIPEEGRVDSILDGGETVYAKIFDDEGYEYIDDGCGLVPK